MIQETPQMRVRENIWDKNSDAFTNQDELEQTTTDIRKHFNFILSPEMSQNVFHEARTEIIGSKEPCK